MRLNPVAFRLTFKAQQYLRFICSFLFLKKRGMRNSETERIEKKLFCFNENQKNEKWNNELLVAQEIADGLKKEPSAASKIKQIILYVINDEKGKELGRFS